MLKKLPIGISTLSEIINNNCVYVDKTRFISKLVEQKYYFLSRPRRFGKTLFLDTLKQAFLGNKELFQGLYLENNWSWSKKYPVIHISFAGSSAHQSAKSLHDAIDIQLQHYAREFNIVLPNYQHALQFEYLIKEIAKNPSLGKVVVLIDEYDKPILDVIDNPDQAIENREVLKAFYGVLKDCDSQLHFVLLTGVTKFAKAGIFSNLNNLNDITFDSEYADICGYTQNDIETTFKDYLVDVDLSELRRWYNGYNFLGEDSQKVYNPFDILLFISKGKLYKNYWFETGTPSFLIKLLQKKCYYIPKIEGLKLTDSALGSFDIGNLSIEVLLLQSGYLTLKSVEMDSMMGIQIYTLDYPNFEVRQSLNDSILANMFANDSGEISNYKFQMKNVLISNDFDRLKTVLISFLASIPHNWYTSDTIQHYEGYYCSVIYTFFNAMGLNVLPEDKTNLGQIDLTIQLADKIIILEFKMLQNGDVADALQQIKDKRYHEKYLSLNKPIYLIGAVFDGETRNICEYGWELLKIVRN